MQLEEARTIVNKEWTNPLTVEAWTRWHPKIRHQQQAFADEIVRLGQVRPGMKVLDLASGTGEPAISLARTVGLDGLVVVTDLSLGMLAAAEKNAREAGVSNLQFRQVDAHDLPFEDASFDVVTCRLGVMYFVDSAKAFAEIRRVLKPGGHYVLATWGPPERSPYFLTQFGPFLKRVILPAPDPDAPQPLRYAEPGKLAAELRASGFSSVNEEVRVIDFPWPGPPEELFQELYDVAIPMRPIFDGLPTAEGQAARAEVSQELARYYDGRETITPASLNFAWGNR